MSKETDIAWCAGFFDGEGHVSYKRSYPHPKSGNVSPMLMCSVAQSADNVEVLEHFQSIIGFGTLQEKLYRTKKKPKRLVTFGVKEVETLLQILKPYLKSRKTLDFQRALMCYYTHDSKPTSDDHLRALKRDQKKMRA
jgi:hypothetical protein